MMIERSRGRGPVPHIKIRPRRGWGDLALGELWRSRDLLTLLIARNVKGRYRQMALGPMWMILQPLVNMVLFTLLFGKLAKLPSEEVPYSLFTYTALVPWTFFATATQGSVGSLISNMNVISKVYFPRLVAPVAAVFTGLVDLSISFSLLLLMLAYHKVTGSFVSDLVSWRLLTLPLWIFLATVTALGVGLWNAALAVRFRDLRHVTQYGLRVWMYGSPVAYSATLIPERWEFFYQLNPMFWVIEGFRWSLLGRGTPPGGFAIASAVAVILLLVSGLYVFQRAERTVVDLL